jgi:hypothetical protein
MSSKKLKTQQAPKQLPKGFFQSKAPVVVDVPLKPTSDVTIFKKPEKMQKLDDSLENQMALFEEEIGKDNLSAPVVVEEEIAPEAEEEVDVELQVAEDQMEAIAEEQKKLESKLQELKNKRMNSRPSVPTIIPAKRAAVTKKMYGFEDEDDDE